MFKFIDTFLNKITMYRLTLYYLGALVSAAVIYSFLGILPYSPVDIVFDTTIAITVCFVANKVFAKFFGAVTNNESALITALILVLIVPLKFPVNITFLIGAAGLAMLAKYLATVEKHHIFNPAAVSVAAFSLATDKVATWWIGTPVMLPFVLLGGLLVLRKIQRGSMVFSFLITVFLLLAGATLFHTGSLTSIFSAWQKSIFGSALFFFAFIMLTEPITSPTHKRLQQYYGVFVAFLYATPQLRLLGFAISPELALCGGNMFSYIVNPQYHLKLPLRLKKIIAPQTYLFSFSKPDDFHFAPGQYMEWTLPHKNVDSRGTRRYFSIASSPDEQDLLILLKYYTPPSSFKKTLVSMEQNQSVIASQLAGDFILPKDTKKPLVFVAGGVGIAPFRSMVAQIIEKKQQRDIILFFANRHKEDIVFADLFEQAKLYGLKTIYTLTDIVAVPPDWSGEKGYITTQMLQKYIPDCQDRIFYLSGPQLMVERFKTTLEQMHIKKNHIVVDFFPGYSDT
ncbi:MAG TPA: hypothetical protein VLF68_03525 [Candidatus Saccharimonadales bacterium]|nr:hypothetical protein [Candidatus Saccharimonadales bacterium]